MIPHTELARAIEERGIDIEEISAGYAVIPPRWANLLVYVLTLGRPPRRVFDWLIGRVEASGEAPPLYPMLGLVLRAAYLAGRAIGHLRFMDFSTIPGHTGYVLWRTGVIPFWQRRMRRRLPAPPAARPPRELGSPAVAAAGEGGVAAR